MLRGLGGGGSGVTTDQQPLVRESGPEQDIELKVARMLAAGREIRAHLREPITSDHSCLHDEETGLPRS
jgi:hypothetical protein